jgi:hypothetical protein
LLFPGTGIAVFLLSLMIGPLVALTFLFDGLTFRWHIGSLHLRLRRPPVLSLIVLYVFVLVPALFHIHTVRLIADSATAERKPLGKLFEQWVKTCASPDKDPVQAIIGRRLRRGDPSRIVGSGSAEPCSTGAAVEGRPCAFCS